MTDEQEKVAFSKRLNELCDDMGVPPKGQARQTTLAKIFKVSQNATRKWLENDGFCSLVTGKQIANWGAVSFNWLMTGEGNKRPDDESPLLRRYRSADPATRMLIDIALANPEDPLPEGLSPSLKTIVSMARAAIANDLDQPNRS